jgi:hypothetical protein
MSVKLPPCAICVDRTRGKTEQVRLGYGVSVWLCQAHADPQFLRKRGGRDFVLTMSRLWRSHGCLTAARSKALHAYLSSLHPSPRRRPGSYAWPELRLRAERLFAAGAPLQVVMRDLEHQSYGAGRPPSLRTVYRWRNELR